MLAVLASSHIIDAFCVLPMAFFLAPTSPTVMVDVHTVSVCIEVSSNVTDVFTVYPLGVCLPLSVYQYSGPLLFTAFACWSSWVKAATVAVRLTIILH